MRTNGGWLALFGLWAMAEPAAAEVKSASASAFEIESSVEAAVSSAEAYAALGRVSDWWNPEHSYSGKAQNLRLDLRAGGCFCETTDGGGTIEHMRVVYAQPGKLLRLQGALGPLQAQAVTGTFTWTFEPLAGGGTRISQTYLASGHFKGGADKLAPIVDRVLSEQLQRLQRQLGARR